MAQTTESTIFDIKVDFGQSISKLAEYNTKIDECKKQMKSLKDEVKNHTISESEYQQSMAATKETMKGYSDSAKAIEREMHNNVTAQKANEGSLVQLRAELSNLTKQYDALSAVEREEGKGVAMKAHINEITNSLKEGEEATQRYQRNVGNYKNSFSEALSAQLPFMDKLKSLNTMLTDTGKGAVGMGANMAASSGGVGALKTAFAAASQGVKAFANELLALLANPVVLVIAAIAVAIKAVVEGIKSSEENTNKFNQILAPFKAVLEAVLYVIQKMTGAVLDAFAAYQQLMLSLTKLCEQLPLVGSLFKAYDEDVERHTKAARLDAEANEYEYKKIRANATDNLKVQELMNQSRQKQNYTLSQRRGFVIQAINLEKQMSEREVALAKMRYAALLAESKGHELSEEENKKLAESYAAVQNAQASFYQSTMRAQSRLSTFNQEAASDAQAAREKAKQAQEEAKQRAEQAAQEAEQRRNKEKEAIRTFQTAAIALEVDGEKKKRLQLQVTYNNEVADLRTRLKTEHDLTTKARQAIIDTIKAKTIQFNRDIEALDQERRDKQVTNEKTLNDDLLASVEKGSESEFQLKLAQIDLNEQADIKAAEKAATTEEEKQALISAIQRKYNAQRDDLANEHYSAMLQQRLKDLQEQYDLTATEGELDDQSKLEEYQREADFLQQKRDLIISNTEITEKERKDLIAKVNKEIATNHEKTANAEIKIEQTKRSAIVGALMGLSEAMQAVGNENTALAKLGKVVGMAEALTNEGVALSAAIKSASGLPFPANLGAIATSIAQILAMFTTVFKTIKSAKFAQGGSVIGAGTGTSDSIPAMLSNGESVLTAQATQMFAPLLSTMNTAGGGVPIMAVQNSQQTMGEDMLARAVARGVSNMPSPIVSVRDIADVQHKVKVMSNLSSVG
jgi:hypothetical protein